MEVLKLFHTGYLEIKEPDVHFGRKNAVFQRQFQEALKALPYYDLIEDILS